MPYYYYYYYYYYKCNSISTVAGFRLLPCEYTCKKEPA